MTTMLLRETLTEAAARRLRGVLAEQRISGSAVARALGMPQSAISRRMLAKTDMTLPEIEAVCAAAGLSPEYLVFGMGEPIADFEQLEKLQNGDVPPAGFEPAAFRSGDEPSIPETTGRLYFILGGAA